MLGRDLALWVTATVPSGGWQLLWLQRVVLAVLLPVSRNLAPCEAPPGWGNSTGPPRHTLTESIWTEVPLLKDQSCLDQLDP